MNPNLNSPQPVKLYCKSLKLIRFILILGVLGISSLGCQSSSPTVSETQTSPPTPSNTQASLPIEPEPLAVPLTPPANPIPIATQPTTRTPLATLPTRSDTQVFSPTPTDIPALPTLPETQALSPTAGKPQTHSSLPLKPSTGTSTNQVIKTLPDGDYFYGESPELNSPGRKYVVFRKTGNLIVGQEYFLQTDTSHCFRGTADLNSIDNVKIAYFEPSLEGAKWLFGELESIKTTDLHQLGFEKAPEFATANLRECIKILSNEI